MAARSTAGVLDGYRLGMADTDKLDVKKVNFTLNGLKDELKKALKNNESLRAKAQQIKQEGLMLAANVLATAEVVGMAFGMGFLRGYYGEKAAILGLPIDAATGLLLHGIGYGLGFAGGRTARFVAANLHNLANGSLATWASASGAQLGFKKRDEAQATQQSQQLPSPPQAASAGTPESMAFGAQHPPQLMSPQMWGPWAGQASPWGIPQQQGNPMTQEELAAAMAWQQAAA
jgi:hypothetical protein